MEGKEPGVSLLKQMGEKRSLVSEPTSAVATKHVSNLGRLSQSLRPRILDLTVCVLVVLCTMETESPREVGTYLSYAP